MIEINNKTNGLANHGQVLHYKHIFYVRVIFTNHAMEKYLHNASFAAARENKDFGVLGSFGLKIQAMRL